MKERYHIISSQPGDEYFPLCTAIRNEYLFACILVLQEGAPIAQLSLYDNPYLSYQGQKVWLTGNIICPDEQEVFNAMIGQVVRQAQEKGIAFLAGPMDGSTWNDYRLALSDEKAFTGDLAHPSYYADLFRRAGFGDRHHYCSSRASLQPATLPAEISLADPVSIRSIDLSRFEEELKAIYPLCMAAFARNVWYSPISEQEFVAKYLPYAPLIDPRFVLLAEQEGKILAFLFCYPDRQNSKQLVIKTIARHPACRIKKLIAAMIATVYHRACAAGYTHIIHALMHDNNISFALSGRYHGTIIRRYTLFLKPISNHAG